MLKKKYKINGDTLIKVVREVKQTPKEETLREKFLVSRNAVGFNSTEIKDLKLSLKNMKLTPKQETTIRKLVKLYYEFNTLCKDNL